MEVVRGILAILFGWIVGSAVNMGLITLGPYIVPPPPGVDITTMEGLVEAMPLMQFKHFVIPFLAHALGTLAGAFVACLIAEVYRMHMAVTIGVFFLIGGVMMVYMLPSQPLLNIIADICLAYIPMAFLGGKLALMVRKDELSDDLI